MIANAKGTSHTANATEMPSARNAAGSVLRALEGVRVLDLTTSIAGPYATMLLGDLGADVVKVERKGEGDDARAWGPPFLDGESLWFLSVNRNKRSITLDYSTQVGRAVLCDLIQRSDILVVNFPPATLEKLGIDPRSVHTLKPDLIYVSISGFGLEGERSGLPCYDLIAEGYSGVMDLTGEPDSPPQKIGAPAADMLAGMDAAFGALAAFVERGKTGKGRVVEVALVDSMVRFLSCRIVPYLGSGERVHRAGGKDSVIAVYQAFETKDHPITLGLGNDGLWRRFWIAVGKPAIAEQPSWNTNEKRRGCRHEIVAEIQEILLTRCRLEWLQVFAEARVPAGPLNGVADAVNDQLLIDRGLFYWLAKAGRRVPQVGLGFLFDGDAIQPRCAPPRLGEHSEAVLREWLGYDTQQTAMAKGN